MKHLWGKGSGFRVWSPGSMPAFFSRLSFARSSPHETPEGSGLRVQGLGFRVQGLEFRM